MHIGEKVTTTLNHLDDCPNCTAQVKSSEDPFETAYYWTVSGHICSEGKSLIANSENRFKVLLHLVH